MILFASDLDNTLIHSYKRTNTGICVDIKDGRPMSFMSDKSYEMLQIISEKVEFLPITTRSLDQYSRLRLLKDKYPKYALTSNGGILLVDNVIDEEWYRKSKMMINDCMEDIQKSLNILNKDTMITLDARIVDGLFVFAKTKDIEFTEDRLKEKLDLKNLVIKKHKDKIYILPRKLNKGTALNRAKNILGYDFVIGAGDSLFDVPMLQHSNIPIIPLSKGIDIYIKNENTLIFDTIGTKFSENVLEFVMKYSEFNE